MENDNTNWKKELTEATASVALPSSHVITTGETLWSIAEKYYSSGYNWVDIQTANPTLETKRLPVGAVVVVPKVVAKEPTTGTIRPSVVDSKIMGDSYVVMPGDNLWQIAVRAYGDGYQWVQVAKFNELSNPGLIHPGNNLRLPRDGIKL